VAPRPSPRGITAKGAPSTPLQAHTAAEWKRRFAGREPNPDFGLAPPRLEVEAGIVLQRGEVELRLDHGRVRFPLVRERERARNEAHLLTHADGAVRSTMLHIVRRVHGRVELGECRSVRVVVDVALHLCQPPRGGWFVTVGIEVQLSARSRAASGGKAAAGGKDLGLKRGRAEQSDIARPHTRRCEPRTRRAVG
jgi:hypothetical protein